MTNGVIIDAESGLPLIAMVGYQPNECTNTHTPHLYMQAHMDTHSLSPSVSPSHTISSLLGSHRCTYAHKPPTSANKVTHPDIPLSTSLDLRYFLCGHAHTHMLTTHNLYNQTGSNSFVLSNLSHAYF